MIKVGNCELCNEGLWQHINDDFSEDWEEVKITGTSFFRHTNAMHCFRHFRDEIESLKESIKLIKNGDDY